MHHALELERRQGELISFLFGLPDFYERLGYVVVMPWYSVHVSLDSLRGPAPEPKLLDSDPRFGEEILGLYQENVKKRVGPVSRDSSLHIRPWKPVRWRVQGVLRVLTGSGDEVLGYVYHREPSAEDFEVAEAFAVGQAAYEKLFAYLVHETRRRGKKEFFVAVPPDDPFGFYLRQHDARFVVTTRRSGGGMARIVNLPGLCQVLTAVFRERVSGWRRELIPRHLVLRGDGDEGRVELGGEGPPARIEGALPLITQLLFGYRTLDETSSSGLLTEGMSPELNGVLFPSGWPFMYLRDRF